jgi:CubicO group peptidase (beta-lactamase class C family)
MTRADHVGGSRLEQAVHDAAERAGRRPGLLVVGAADDTDTEVASAGSVQTPAGCAPERVISEVGSVTKVFTALLLAIAVERGEADLDDPVADHLPDGTRVPRRDAAAITLGHLATHTSGLPRLPPGFTWHGLRHRDDPYADLSPADVLDALMEEGDSGTRTSEPVCLGSPSPTPLASTTRPSCTIGSPGRSA